MDYLLSKIYNYQSMATHLLLRHLLPILFATLVLPLAILSLVISYQINATAQHSSDNLATILELKAKVNDLLPTLLIQDDAAKAILIDSAMLEKFSKRKFAAYAKHQRILKEIYEDANEAKVKVLIDNLRKIDTENLLPIDAQILEALSDNLEKARKLYFETYIPHRNEYESLVQELYLETMNQADSLASKVEVENSSLGIRIQLILLFGLLSISLIIVFLARLLRQAQDNINILMGSLREGLFFFNKDGQISAERAKSTESIIPGSNNTHNLVDLFQLIGVETKNVQVTLALLWTDPEEGFFSDFATTVSMLPKSARCILDGEERNLRFEYRPQFKDNRLERVVVVVSDVTEKLRLEQDAATQNERVRKVAKAAEDMRSFGDFASEVNDLIKVATDSFSHANFRKEAKVLKRALHTLKGNLAIFEFASISNMVHSLETMLDQPELDVSDQEILDFWRQIKEKWRNECTDINAILGFEKLKSRLILARSVYEKNFDQAKKDQKIDVIKSLTGIRCLPASEIFAKYEVYLTRLCERRGNKAVGFAFKEDSDNIAFEEVKNIDSTLMHILSNCVDHGIEECSQREKLGKPHKGTIKIGTKRKKEGKLHLLIQDDGAGIDYEKLATKAYEQGIWNQERLKSASLQEKVELIFYPGLSTAERISDTSGRGIGMDVVRATLTSLGGSIHVHSEPGTGTCFEIDLPMIPPWDYLVK